MLQSPDDLHYLAGFWQSYCQLYDLLFALPETEAVSHHLIDFVDFLVAHDNTTSNEGLILLATAFYTRTAEDENSVLSSSEPPSC